MLYNNDLWGMPSFLHNGVDSKLLMQIYLSKDNQSLSLCLFGVGKILKNGCYSQYILLTSQEKGKLSPLPRNMIPQVMEQLRAFTDAGTLAEILSEIYEPRMFPGKGFQYVSLSPRL